MKRKDFDRIKNLVDQMLEKGAYDDNLRKEGLLSMLFKRKLKTAFRN